MRKNLILGKRLACLALALSMILGETGAVFAEPVSINAIPSSDNTQTAEDVNGEEWEESEDDSSKAGENGEEISDENEEDKNLIADTGIGLYNVSDVIGLNGYCTANTFTDDNYDSLLDYVYTYKSENPILKNTRYTKDSNDLYLVDGKYYSYVYNDCDIMCSLIYPQNELAIISGTKNDYWDSQTGLYKINGEYYDTLYDLKDPNGQITGVAYAFHKKVILAGPHTKEFLESCGRKANTKYPHDHYDYYEVNGKFYKDIYEGVYGMSYVSYYVREWDEIDFNKAYAAFAWNSIVVGDEIAQVDGHNVKVGFDIKINGEECNRCKYTAIDSNGKMRRFTPYNYYTASDIALSANESVSIAVHPFYYFTIQVDEQNNIYENRIIAEAKNWTTASYSYVPEKPVQPVSGVTATYENDKIKVNWNPSVEYRNVRIYRIESKKQLNINTQNYYLYYNNMEDKNSAFFAENGINEDDYTTSWDIMNNTVFKEYWVEKDTPYLYRYYVVVPYIVNNKYSDFQGLSTVSCMASVDISPKQGLNTPDLQDFKIEYVDNGQVNVIWKPVDAKVQIFYYDKPQFPKFFNLYSLRAMRKVGTDPYVQTYYLDNEFNDDESEIKKVKAVICDGNRGTCDLQEYLKANRNYYILACTYDDTNYKTVKKDVPLVYTDRYGDTKSYDYYVQFSQPTATVHVKKEFAKPILNTTVTKNSVKLIAPNLNATGMEIYRRSGKKYKKIATITDDTYNDNKLKANTKYYYKARYYNYDVDTKKLDYSPFTYLSLRTGIAANIDLKVTENTKTSTKLLWNKVSGVSRYEIYRSNSENCNPKIISKNNSSSNYSLELKNQRFELIKTIKKASTTSYTDKKLETGEKYTYVILAYYQNGKTIEYVTDSEEIELVLKKVENIRSVNKGTSIKISWNPDKYAVKYEIQYNYYDMFDQLLTKEPDIITTKKNSCTINGVPEGGYVKARIRAQGKDNKYTEWTEISETTSLGVTSGIKAVNTKYTQNNGRKADAVKITWKPVSGAKYYKVYRSMVEGRYNEDTKRYVSEGVLIAKESNDNYFCDPYSSYNAYRTDNEVLYQEYNDIEGSIIATTAYDCADLSVGVKYYYSVVAFGETVAAGHDSKIYSKVNRFYWNCEATGKPANVLYNAKPVINKITNKKTGKAVLNWSGIKGATRYYIYRSTKKGKGYKLIGSTKKRSYTDTKVKKGKTYYYKVSAKGKNGLMADMETNLSNAKKIKVKK